MRRLLAAGRATLLTCNLVAPAIASGAPAQSAGQPVAAPPPATKPTVARAAALAPYLTPAEAALGARLLPPPPDRSSPEQMLDGEVFLRSRVLRQRHDGDWQLAASDAAIDPEAAVKGFGCALGLAPSPGTTPALDRLLIGSASLVSAQAAAARPKFGRAGPATGNKQPICLSRFRKDGKAPTYPSGPAAIGWSLALILAELAPDRAADLLALGRSIGDGGVACGTQWRSDAEAGREQAAALVALMHASAAFRHDLETARVELETAHPGTSAAACAALHETW